MVHTCLEAICSPIYAMCSVIPHKFVDGCKLMYPEPRYAGFPIYSSEMVAWVHPARTKCVGFAQLTQDIYL